MKRIWHYGLISLILILSYSLVVHNEYQLNAASPLTPAQVEYIIDGDTLVVTLDGKKKKVRLIGVNTPEIGEAGSEEATVFVEDVAPVGSIVYLEADLHDTDKYGRLLRYVWLTPIPDDFMSHCLTGLLLQKHLGAPLWIDGDTRYKALTSQ